MALLDFLSSNNQDVLQRKEPVYFNDQSPLVRLGLALGGRDVINQYNDMQSQGALRNLGNYLASGAIDQSQYLKGLAQYSPEIYDKIALSQFGIDQPADVKSWMYRNNLPTDKQVEFDAFRRAPQWLNAGNQFVNPVTNNSIPIAPKVEEMPDFKRKQAAATAGGTIEGQQITGAQAGLGDFLAGAQNRLSVIDQMIGNDANGLKEHPGLENAVGGIKSKLPSIRDATIDFENLLEQAKSGAFLDSIQKMQGFGALSNEEGAKATTAATRMKTASSPEGFRKAAKEYRDIITSGIERMQNKAALSIESDSVFPAPENIPTNGTVTPNAKPSGAEKAAALPDAKFPSKTINGKTYIKQNGKWYEQ